jgi:hypothetical protein
VDECQLVINGQFFIGYLLRYSIPRDFVWAGLWHVVDANTWMSDALVMMGNNKIHMSQSSAKNSSLLLKFFIERSVVLSSAIIEECKLCCSYSRGR